MEARSSEWRQIARGRREFPELSSQLTGPHKLRIACASDDEQPGYEARPGEKRKQHKQYSGKKDGQRKKAQGSSDWALAAGRLVRIAAITVVRIGKGLEKVMEPNRNGGRSANYCQDDRESDRDKRASGDRYEE